MIIITNDQCTIAGTGIEVLSELTMAIYRLVEISVNAGFPKEDVEELVHHCVDIAFLSEEEMDQHLAELYKELKDKVERETKKND